MHNVSKGLTDSEVQFSVHFGNVYSDIAVHGISTHYWIDAQMFQEDNSEGRRI